VLAHRLHAGFPWSHLMRRILSLYQLRLGVGSSEHGSPAGLASINGFVVECPDSISNAGMPHFHWMSSGQDAQWSSFIRSFYLEVNDELDKR
jgi:hypothetical protein